MTGRKLRTRSFVAEITLHRCWYVEIQRSFFGFTWWGELEDTRAGSEQEAIDRAKLVLSPEPSNTYFAA